MLQVFLRFQKRKKKSYLFCFLFNMYYTNEVYFDTSLLHCVIIFIYYEIFIFSFCIFSFSFLKVHYLFIFQCRLELFSPCIFIFYICFCQCKWHKTALMATSNLMFVLIEPGLCGWAGCRRIRGKQCSSCPS